MKYEIGRELDGEDIVTNIKSMKIKWYGGQNLKIHNGMEIYWTGGNRRINKHQLMFQLLNDEM